jgi:hypothetical protein
MTSYGGNSAKYRSEVPRIALAREERSRPSTFFMIANLAGWIFIDGVTHGQYSLVVSVTFL